MVCTDDQSPCRETITNPPPSVCVFTVIPGRRITPTHVESFYNTERTKKVHADQKQYQIAAPLLCHPL